MKSTLRLNTKIVPILGLLAILMQILDADKVWVILGITMGGTWLFCLWWVRGLARSLTFEREIRYGWAQVGDRLEERFTLTNTFNLPATWVTVFDHSDLPDHFASVATGVDANSNSQWKIQSQCTRRGVYTLGGTTLETGDPLGLFTLTLEDETSSTLAVMPPVVALPKFSIASKGWTGEGRRSTRSLEETIHASQVREMLPNDPMRLIHWKSTAKQNKFFVRQFEGTPAGNWWILLDLDEVSQLGAGFDATEEHAVILAASLAQYGLNEEHPVGLAINGHEPEWVAPRRNDYQSRSLLKSLAKASPSAMDLRTYLERIGSSLGSHCSLLVITTNANNEWTESLLPLIRRGIMPTVFTLDPISFGGQADTGALEETLQSFGVPCHIIPRQFLSAKQIRPGHAGEWEWRVVGTGKAVAVNAPVADWRKAG